MVNERDVQGVQKKIHEHLNRYADKIIVSQYSGNKSVTREDGETWTDVDGKEWVQEGKYAQSVSKLIDAKTPWWCPVCGSTLKDIDVKFYRLRGKCHGCVVKEETEMRIDGTWKDYNDGHVMRNQMSALQDRIIELAYYLETLCDLEFPIFDEERGNLLMIEKWNLPLDEVREKVGEDLVALNNTLTEIEEEYVERFGALPGEETNEE
jgi:hypothetical protein